jgi:hypothetical protein
MLLGRVILYADVLQEVPDQVVVESLQGAKKH